MLDPQRGEAWWLLEGTRGSPGSPRPAVPRPGQALAWSRARELHLEATAGAGAAGLAMATVPSGFLLSQPHHHQRWAPAAAGTVLCHAGV